MPPFCIENNSFSSCTIIFFYLQKMRVQVRFAPTLPSDKIKQEAVRVVVRKAEERAQKEYEERLKREKEEAETQAVSVCT